jgi:predicted RNA binding protein YcfA (HicA-like mRNA interferase family)
MSRLPIVNFKKMEKILHYLGFVAVRQKGSHIFYRHQDGRTTTLPNHPGKDLARPLIREILREIEITPEEYKELIDNL